MCDQNDPSKFKQVVFIFRVGAIQIVQEDLW